MYGIRMQQFEPGALSGRPPGDFNAAANSCRLFVCNYNVCIYIYICAHTDACTYYYFYYYHYYNISGKSSRRVCARTRIILTAYTHTSTNMHRYTHTQARALHRTETTSLEYFNSL